MISFVAKLQFLKNYKFPPRTTDKEKIVFAYTKGYTVRQTAQCFCFGFHKICRVIKHYKETGEILKPVNHSKLKLTPDGFASIHSSILADAHSTLEKMRENIQKDLNINISKSSAYNGCTEKRYKYKPP